MEFNSLRFTLRLIEGMYEEKRLEISEESKVHLEKLSTFNTKLDNLQKDIVAKEVLTIDKAGDNKREIFRKWKKNVNVTELKSEATIILELLQCPIKI